MMWIDIGVTLLLALRTTLSKPSLPRLLEPSYEGPLAARESEENVVRPGRSRRFFTIRQSSPPPKTKTAAITYLCNAEF
jgi:hypothetical protein